MSRKMEINRLDKDELIYELTWRGIALGTVDEMRGRLVLAKQMEKSGDSLHYPYYPFSFQEDVAIVTKKLDELVLAVEAFTESSKSGKFLKLQTKLSHVLGRIDNMSCKALEEGVVKSELVAQTLSLMDKLQNKAADAPVVYQQPPNLCVLEGSVSRVPGIPISCSSSIDEVPQPPAESSLGVGIKPILPHKWNLKFTGDKRGMSVTAFFERVDQLRTARNVSKQILLNSGIDLFEGRAYEFYQDCRSEVNTWDQLVHRFKEEYQPAFYSEKLLEEIKRRTQGEDESIGTYMAVMSKYFQRLECSISEEAKLTILLRNISPTYRNQLGALEINSISELKSLCKRIETRLQSEYTPPRKGQSLEPDLAYISMAPEASGVSDVCAVQSSTNSNTTNSGLDSRFANKKRTIVCFNCNKEGHKAIGCAEPRKLVCFGCRKVGVTKRTCPSCNQGNGRMSS